MGQLSKAEAERDAIDDQQSQNGGRRKCCTQQKEICGNRKKSISGSLAIRECKHRMQNNWSQEVGLPDREVEVSERESIEEKERAGRQCGFEGQTHIRGKRP